MNIQTLADVTPGGTATALSATDIRAATVIIAAPAANAAAIRVGDVNVGANRGAVVAAGTSLTLPRLDFSQGGWQLKNVYVYGSTTDKVTITYGA